MDAIIAFLSRVLASDEKPAVREDIEKYIRAFLGNHPELAKLINHRAGPPALLDGRLVHPMEILDPDRFAEIVEAFAARMALALYFEATGQPAPLTAGIAARWYSNVQLFGGDYPRDFLTAIGNPRTLTAGKNSVPDQFRYWSAFAPGNPSMFGVFAAFRESFGIMAIVRTPDDGEASFRPGFLNGLRF